MLCCPAKSLSFLCWHWNWYLKYFDTHIDKISKQSLGMELSEASDEVEQDG